MKLSMLIVPLFFLGLGLVALILGAINFAQEEKFFATAVHSTATLTRYVPDPNPKAAGFCPEYEFTTQDGQDVSYIGDACISEPDKSRIGQTEEAYYAADNPQSIESRGLLGSEGSGLILGLAFCIFFPLVGLLILGGGLWQARAASKRRAKYFGSS